MRTCNAFRRPRAPRSPRSKRSREETQRGPLVKLIIQPADGVGPIVTAIKRAKTRVEIAIFRFDRTDIETALKAAAERGVKVTVLIAFANRGGEQRLRRLELRCLAA